MKYNGYIYCKELKRIVNIEYNTSHLLYYWYRYVVYLIKNKEIERLSDEQKKNENQKKLEILNNLAVKDSVNFLFVLDDDVKSPGFYKALSLFIQKPENRKPLISFGVFDLDSIETYAPVYYLDSSIWNYYLNVLDNKEKKGNNDKGLARESGNSIFTKKLTDIIVSILTNYTKQLYNLTVAKEFIEFQSRLLGNSHLGLTGGHAAAVAPFIFHSESAMLMKGKETIGDIIFVDR